MRWLLKLYPPAWRRRYEDEMAALLEDQRAGRRTVIDLIRGAADAWIIGPRGPLGGLEVWLALVAYGLAAACLAIAQRALRDSVVWSSVLEGLYWVVFFLFIYWLSQQRAARCRVPWSGRSRR